MLIARSSKGTLVHCLCNAVFTASLAIFLVSTGYVNDVAHYGWTIVGVTLVVQILKLCLEKEQLWWKDVSDSKELLYCLLELFAATSAFYFAAVLYGADVFTEQTLFLSCFLSILTIFPSCAFLGPTYIYRCRVLKSCSNLTTVIEQNLYFTLLGTWLGAFPIPLDWDRPWQEWPIPCFMGALIGSTLINVLHIFHALRN